MNAEAIMGPSVEGVDRFWSTWRSPMTVPMIPMVGAKPPMFAKKVAPALWRRLHSLEVLLHDVSDLIGIRAVDGHLNAFAQEGVVDLAGLVLEGQEPWRRAFSAKETTTATEASGLVTLVVRASFRTFGHVLASPIRLPAVAAPMVPRM